MELSSGNLGSHVGVTVVGAMTQNWPEFVSIYHVSVTGHNNCRIYGD